MLRVCMHISLYGSKIFSTVLSNIVLCSTSRAVSPNFETKRKIGHSSAARPQMKHSGPKGSRRPAPPAVQYPDAASQRDAVQYFSASFRFDLHPARPLAVEQNQHARARAVVSLSFPTLSSWRTRLLPTRPEISAVLAHIFRLFPSIRILHSILLALAARRLLGTCRLLRRGSGWALST